MEYMPNLKWNSITWKGDNYEVINPHNLKFQYITGKFGHHD